MSTSTNSSNCDSEPPLEWMSKCAESNSRSDLACIFRIRLAELVSEFEEEWETSELEDESCDPSSPSGSDEDPSASGLGRLFFDGDCAGTETALDRGGEGPETATIASGGIVRSTWTGGGACKTGIGASSGGRWSCGRF